MIHRVRASSASWVWQRQNAFWVMRAKWRRREMAQAPHINPVLSGTLATRNMRRMFEIKSERIFISRNEINLEKSESDRSCGRTRALVRVSECVVWKMKLLLCMAFELKLNRRCLVEEIVANCANPLRAPRREMVEGSLKRQKQVLAFCVRGRIRVAYRSQTRYLLIYNFILYRENYWIGIEWSRRYCETKRDAARSLCTLINWIGAKVHHVCVCVLVQFFPFSAKFSGRLVQFQIQSKMFNNQHRHRASG